MITLISKKTNPLFIEFKPININVNEHVMFLWEDCRYNTPLFSDIVSNLKNGITYFSQINKSINFFKNNISFKVVSLKDYRILFEYEFINLSFLNGNSLNFISQNNKTGYGYASRNYVYQLLETDYSVDWNVDKFYKSTYQPSNRFEEKIYKCLNKNTNNGIYSECIIHATPNDWERIIKSENIICNNLFGLTTWETTKLSKYWIDDINNSNVEEIIVPSHFNLEVFKNSGIKKPIHVWRHDIFPIEINNIPDIKKFTNKFFLFDNSFVKDDLKIEDILKNKTVYYNISQYSERKNIDQLIKTFCTKFSKQDKVCLFVKTFLQETIPAQIEYLKYKLSKILKNFNNIPDIIFCFEDLSDIEIQSLHHNFDVYFTLNRGEGFGLCSYTAKKFGNKVICGKFGAEKEFLDGNDIMIDYELIPTFNMYNFHNYYDDNDQLWASYKDSDVLKALEYMSKKSK